MTERENRMDESGDRGRWWYVWKGRGGWGICCAILSNPGSITHHHHLPPFTFEVSFLDWTAGYSLNRRVLVEKAEVVVNGRLGHLPQPVVCTDRTGSFFQSRGGGGGSGGF